VAATKMPVGTAVAPSAVAPIADRSTAPAARHAARYMHGPVADVALALAWVPFVAGALVLQRLEGGQGNLTLLAVFISAVFLLSFAHQPLTMALVYGDPEQFRLRRAIFTVSPFVFMVAVGIGFYVSFAIVALVGGIWNAEHTLMQRYGVTRIYGRMAGQDDGLVEKLLLFSWLIAAALWVAADPSTPARAANLPLGENNQLAIDWLVQLRPIAFALWVPAMAAVVVLAAKWLVDERRRATRNPMKWVYLASTAALFVVIVLNPLAGIMGYVGAHALEYFVIVHQSLGKRYGAAPDTVPGSAAARGPLIGRAVRARTGRLGFLAIYVAIIIGIVTVLERAGSRFAYIVVFFTLGGLHVFYDGFIWKLRRPVVAHSLSIPTADAGAATGSSAASRV
jgi:hypothetical protein